MAISFIGQATGVIAATLPAHQAGDLLLAFAYRDGSNTAPTVPVGWTTVAENGANTNASVLAYRVALTSMELSGTWIDATSLIILIYRGALAASAAPIGADAGTGANNSTTVTYPALTLTRTDSTSWVVGFAGHRSTNTAVNLAPSGMINRASVLDATDEASAHDTNGAVNSWSAETVNVGGTASAWRARTVEILERRDYSITADSSSQTVSGQAIEFKKGYEVAATVGLFAQVGPATNLAGTFRFLAGAGNWACDGQNTGLGRGLIGVELVGAFSLTGQDAVLTKSASLSLAANFGSIAADGQSAGLYWNSQVLAEQSLHFLNGQSLALLAGRQLGADAIEMSLTGQGVTLTKGHLVPGASGSFITTGQLNQLLSHRLLVADSGNVAVAGQAAQSIRVYQNHQQAGIFSLTGEAAGLSSATSFSLIATRGEFSLLGQSLNVQATRRLAAAPAVLDAQAIQCVLRAGRVLTSSYGIWTQAGQNAILPWHRRLAGIHADCGLTGQSMASRVSRLLRTGWGEYSLSAFDLSFGAGVYQPMPLYFTAGLVFAVTARSQVATRFNMTGLIDLSAAEQSDWVQGITAKLPFVTRVNAETWLLN